MNAHVHSTLGVDHSTLLNEAKINAAIMAGYEALATVRLSRLSAGVLTEDLTQPDCDTAAAIAEALMMVEKRLEEMTGQLSLIQLYMIRTAPEGASS